MLDEVATEIATGAAGNIIAYMLNGRVDALRAQVARVFRHGTHQEQAAALHAVEDDTAALAQQEASQADLTARWANLLLSYLTAHPEARKDVETLAFPQVVNKTTNIGSQHNHGSGIFIGGDNYGTINPRGQE
jgi:hypothetical protein